ncbi:uncharacterized protein LOC112510101 [Cynara cardunculus var. scolymus]|uniref:uncharacterized protein LOC112510101 n=1 Tax=Cynara cardunculus var. scolymus TaxID=59895 RepID=UPI000D62B9CB|nr:uncharacterized protein LOC112510101 [Cynara cardunculus var. scolymus]
MGFQPPPELSTPPKLSLYSLPSKPPTLPPDGLTPPLNTVATIPFLWEEAPGKPRATDDPPKSKTVRSLDLPPRLTTTTTTTTTVSPMNNGVGIQIVPSPTTVLSGPYEGVLYGSNTLLESPEKAPVVCSKSKSKGKMRMPLRKLMRKDRSPVKFSSWRWDSLKDMEGGRMERSPSLKLCSWRWDSFRDMGGGGSLCSSFDDGQKAVDHSGDKLGKVTRKSSFTFAGDATNTSSFLTNMLGTFKKAMPWRSRR